MMINIISTFYVSKYSSNLDNLRSKELEQCILNNISCPFIEKIHLFIDDNDALNRLTEITNKSDKIVIISIGVKPKYSDFFNYIIKNVNNKICMITNSDIYLLQCDMKLIENLNNNKIAYALTRYEYDMSHPLIDNYAGSHDCYIFNSRFISEKIINEHTNFYQNFPGIETHIIKALCDEDYKVYNPCKQIKIVHLHKTQLRNHGQWIGLHRSGDFDYHKKSCWWVPPVIL
jgi:hypothetical protein